MTAPTSGLQPKLFYSYSHKDAQYRQAMEDSLAILRRDNLLNEWSDQQILPGQNITPQIEAQLDQADIIVFLVSQHFLASDECVKEWEYARQVSERRKPIFRIPIILRDCPWLDLLGEDDVKALPDDGKPVRAFDDPHVAWHQVYRGIRSVVEQLMMTFTPRQCFLDQVRKTDFISEDHINLQDLFVFPRMTISEPKGQDNGLQQTTVSDCNKLLELGNTLIHGQEKIGKTALSRHLFLSLIDEAKPVLLLDLAQADSKPTKAYLRETYHKQFHGDFDLWTAQSDTTLIVDNMTAAPRMLEVLDIAAELFDRIVIILSSDIFYSFFIDESRVATFRQLQIEPLSREQQESLIRKRLALSAGTAPISDGLVDRAEDHVNSVIITDKLVPRYPFYVLAILQTYEAYMPNSMSITSYGHCYYVLIFASLMRAGISKTDDAVSTCFNFAEQLAFTTYQHEIANPQEPFDFGRFVENYKQRFFIKNSILNRLKHPTYGLITATGAFRSSYMHYYFLGRFLASNGDAATKIIDSMCESSHIESNYLTLLFTIHHTNSNSIIDDILLRTMCTLDAVRPASLDDKETKRFGDILADLPENILSSDSVEDVRRTERAKQDEFDEVGTSNSDSGADAEVDCPVNGIYRILKNNKIMGQILRNKHGVLERPKIEETVEVVADSGLRLVNFVLKDEEEIAEIARFIKARNKDWSFSRIKKDLRFFSFVWTMVNIEQIVDAINVPEIREAVNAVVNRKSTPAYELVGYFSQLDRANELTDGERNKLQGLMKKYDDVFVHRVLSMRTQHYMNTHHSKAMIEQAMCSIMNIKYVPRMVRRA